MFLPELLLKGLPALIASGASFLGRGENRDLQLKRLEQERDFQDLRLRFQAAQEQERQLHQSVEAERNRIAQLENSQAQQAFTGQENAYNRASARENLLTQLDAQHELQLKIKQLDAELARELKRFDRETALNQMKEQRRNQNNPLVNHVEDLLTGEMLHVFFAPPTVRGDRNAVEQTLKVSETILASALRDFLESFKKAERAVVFHGGQWQTRAVHSETAARNIHRELKTEAAIILETFSEGHFYHIHVAFWAENWTDVRYQRLFSFDWTEVLKLFAKVNTLKRQEEALTDEDFIDFYGKPAFETYKKNLDTIGKEERARRARLSEKDIKRNISSKYIPNQDDQESVIEYIKLHHAFAVGVLMDEYYLLHAALEQRRPPLLPQLLPQLLEDYELPAAQKETLLAQLADFYTQLYDFSRQKDKKESPELYLELADLYTQLNAPDKAQHVLETAATIFLQNRCIPTLPKTDTPHLSFLIQAEALPYLSDNKADKDFLADLAHRVKQVPVLEHYSILQGSHIMVWQGEKTLIAQRNEATEQSKLVAAALAHLAEQKQLEAEAIAKQQAEENRIAEQKRLEAEAEANRQAELARIAEQKQLEAEAAHIAEETCKPEEKWIAFLNSLSIEERSKAETAEQQAILKIKNSQNAKELDLSFLGLRRVPESIKNLKQLTMLNLSGNQLNDVSSLRDLKQLTTLNLFINELSDISALRDLKQLTTLNLVGNKLRKISTLRDLKQLAILNLVGNEIKNFNLDLALLPNLEELNLRGNPIQNIPEEILEADNCAAAIREYQQKHPLTAEEIERRKIAAHKQQEAEGEANRQAELARIVEQKQLEAEVARIAEETRKSEEKWIAFLNSLPLEERTIAETAEKEAILKIQADENAKELSLNDLGLHRIPEAIKNLKQLTKLGLRSNKLNNISALRDLEQLTTLNLDSNKLSDISALQNLTQLTTLNLPSNKLNDISALRDLKQLTTLDLRGNQLSDISALQNLRQLTTLDLGFNKISDISALQNLRQLTTLDLGFNKISDISALRDLKQLTTLNLYDCTALSDVSSMRDLKHLTTLSLGLEVLSKMMPALRDLKQLTTLKLRVGVRFPDIEFSLLSAICYLNQLKTLDLSNNGLDNEEFSKIIPKLRDLKQLTTLNLAHNSLSDVSSLQDLKQLTTLDLSYNKDIEVSTLQGLKQLTNLNLYWNELTDISALQELKQLTNLNLSSNELTDISALQELKQLTTLELWHNKLSEISALRGLKKLTDLSLFWNQITDVSALQDLKQLTKLQLHGNKVQNFNLDLALLPNLEKLSIAGNSIQNIPKEILEADNCAAAIREYQQKHPLTAEEIELRKIAAHKQQEAEAEAARLVEEKRKKEEVKRRKAFAPEMILVQGGTFEMGGGGWFSNSRPIHQVTLNSFMIGKYPITQAQWKAVMGYNPSGHEGDDLPVEKVSWHAAQLFISKLNSLTGQIYSLPTEAQWEFAARGGIKSNGFKYSGSDYLDRVGRYNGFFTGTRPVGQKQSNELGIYDMSGNVWEWCSDWYGDYSNDAVTNPTGAATGTLRILRGGSWYSDSAKCQVTYRESYSPTEQINDVGFRVVLLT